MTDNTNLKQLTIPIYPPDLETGQGRRFQTPILINVWINDNNWETEALDVRNGVKEMLRVFKEDPEVYESFLVGPEFPRRSTELDSKATNRFGDTTTTPTGDQQGTDSRVKKIKVFYADKIPICPFCWDEGYTSDYQGIKKEHPQGSHRKVKENDIMYSAKYNRPVAMCYDHGETNKTNPGKITDSWIQICQEMETAKSDTYRIEDKEVLIT